MTFERLQDLAAKLSSRTVFSLVGMYIAEGTHTLEITETTQRRHAVLPDVSRRIFRVA